MAFWQTEKDLPLQPLALIFSCQCLNADVRVSSVQTSAFKHWKPKFANVKHRHVQTSARSNIGTYTYTMPMFERADVWRCQCLNIGIQTSGADLQTSVANKYVWFYAPKQNKIDALDDISNWRDTVLITMVVYNVYNVTRYHMMHSNWSHAAWHINTLLPNLSRRQATLLLHKTFVQAQFLISKSV